MIHQDDFLVIAVVHLFARNIISLLLFRMVPCGNVCRAKIRKTRDILKPMGRIISFVGGFALLRMTALV